MPIELDFNKPFAEQIEYFRQKGYAISPNSWRDVWQDAHARAFTVAKVTQMDVLADIRKAANDAMKSGASLEEFKKNLIPTLQAKGWWAGDDDDVMLDGRKRLNAWRLDTIYRANLSTAYHTGRFKQQLEVADVRPFWMYMSQRDARTRPDHALLHGSVYPYNHDFWARYYPPNGFRCRCYVKTLSDRQVEDRGLRVLENMPPPTITPDEGWDFNPGMAGLDSWDPDLSKYASAAKKLIEAELAKKAAIAAAAGAEADAAIAATAITTLAQAEKAIRAATDALSSSRFHRIDLLWDQISGQMTRSEFENWLMELAGKGKVELTGGDPSGLDETQLEKLIKDPTAGFLMNLVWI